MSKGRQYDDVRDAWRHYLERDNRGRGVVLIGHSQGSYILTELLRQEIDGKPVQSRLVSAILLGATFAVANGKDVGGSLQQIPLCHKPAQTGCVVTYVVVPLDVASTREHAIRQGHRAWNGPRRAPTPPRWAGAPPRCTRIWPLTAV